jgi:hypothetical protein
MSKIVPYISLKLIHHDVVIGVIQSIQPAGNVISRAVDNYPAKLGWERLTSDKVVIFPDKYNKDIFGEKFIIHEEFIRDKEIIRSSKYEVFCVKAQMTSSAGNLKIYHNVMFDVSLIYDDEIIQESISK